MKVFDYIVEAVFWIDIILKFFTGYIDDETGKLVFMRRKIARNYVFSMAFVIDIVSTFPLYLFFSNGEFTKILRLIRLPKAAKLFDSSKFESLIECIMKSSPL